MRKAAAALVVLSLTGVTGGAVEIKLHGFSFFLTRKHDLERAGGSGRRRVLPSAGIVGWVRRPGDLRGCLVRGCGRG